MNRRCFAQILDISVAIYILLSASSFIYNLEIFSIINAEFLAPQRGWKLLNCINVSCSKNYRVFFQHLAPILNIASD